MATRTLTELIREVDPDFDSDPPPAEYRFRSGRIFRALPGRGAYDGTIYATEIDAEPGSFIMTGYDAGLFPSEYILSVGSGAFSLTGVDASFAPSLTAGSGAFTFTGQPASLLLGTQFLSAAAGSFTMTGVASAFTSGLSAGAGAYTFTGNDALLSTREAAAISAEVGTFAMTGRDAAFSATMTAGSASFTLTGKAAGLDKLLSPTFATMEASYEPTNNTDLVTRAKMVDLINEALA